MLIWSEWNITNTPIPTKLCPKQTNTSYGVCWGLILIQFVITLFWTQKFKNASTWLRETHIYITLKTFSLIWCGISQTTYHADTTSSKQIPLTGFVWNHIIYNGYFQPYKYCLLLSLMLLKCVYMVKRNSYLYNIINFLSYPMWNIKKEIK